MGRLMGATTWASRFDELCFRSPSVLAFPLRGAPDLTSGLQRIDPPCFSRAAYRKSPNGYSSQPLSTLEKAHSRNLESRDGFLEDALVLHLSKDHSGSSDSDMGAGVPRLGG